MKKILASLSLTLSLSPFSAIADKLPDMVVFITDDQSYIDTQFQGHPDANTPNIDRLAEGGLYFTQAYVASPNCAPSRAAMLTGLMPARNGSEVNQTSPREDVKKLPAYFQEIGYEVVAFGKVSHDAPDAYGFDEHGSEGLVWKGGIKYAVDYLNERESEKPLLMLVGTKDPHNPWPEKEGYNPADLTMPENMVDTPETRENLARFLTSVTSADRQLGTLHALAREKLDNPLFIFTADHGSSWPFSKWNLYDYGIHIPFIASWPGKIKPGQTDAMISWIDIIPTLMEVAGSSAPKDIDGQSFARVLDNPELEHREKIYTTHTGDGGKNFNAYPIRAVQDKRWKLIYNLYPERRHTTHINQIENEAYWDSWEAKAKTDPDAKKLLDRYFTRPEIEFYDLENDPHEQNNLAANPAYAEKIASMKADLEKWMEDQGDQRLLALEPIVWPIKIANWLLF
ncbi:hypothetical protein EOPP23_06240 [Endozoicomonas sp. OPT23]|uniref:sulfatase family protein n=1 Tax=Endozoicomonas sp. OPT23 TaxID=2072845 RepID=UPI00129B85F6|nr:sulfatase [Endozoicomonas sp. OPT23]MRI32585.1 hypothetical protein [Endozoicomonas sp. OPT23]